MDHWTRFGNAIGNRMAFISPCCVAAGVLFPQVFSPIEAIVPILFAIMTFQGSLGNTMRQLASVFRKPRGILVILGIAIVGMPCLARLLGGLFFGNDMQLVTGIVLEYSVPVAVVSVMWVGMYGGNSALAVACVLVSTVLSPFTIPLGMQLLLGQTVQVDVFGMMRNMVVSIALPAISGTLVNDLTHGWGRRTLSPVMSPACKVLLIVIIVANSTEISDYMKNLTPELIGVMVFICLFATSGFVLGLVAARFLGESVPTLVTMCFDCGMRNISAGAVIAAAYFPGEVMFPVMIGTLFQQVLAGIFGTVMHGIIDDEQARNEQTLEAARRAMK